MDEKKYIVRLTGDEKKELHELPQRGKMDARKIRISRLLLLPYEGKKTGKIAEFLHVGAMTAERMKKRFVGGGLEKVSKEDPGPGEKKFRIKEKMRLLQPGHTPSLRIISTNGRCGFWRIMWAYLD